MKKVWIVGTGGVGGYFGGRLAEANARLGLGLHLSFLARGAHLERIREDGLLLETENASYRVRPSAIADRPEGFPSPDIAVLCVKSYDLGEALARTSPFFRKDTVILPLMNGVDISSRIREVTQNGQLLEACVYVGTHVAAPGVVRQKGGDGRIIAGALPGDVFDSEPLLTLFRSAGIGFEWLQDVRPAVWMKYVFISAFGLATARWRKSLDEVYAEPRCRADAGALMREAAAIAVKLGVHLPEDAVAQALSKAETFPAGTRTSFQRDVETPNRANEGDLFGGTILRLGLQTGVLTPMTREYYQAILDASGK